MVICGVELTGNDAVVCLLSLDRGQFSLPESKVRKLSLNRNHTREDLKQFQSAFTDLMAEYGVSRVVIKERMQKGKFAGGAASFKLEAAIQPHFRVGSGSNVTSASTDQVHPCSEPVAGTLRRNRAKGLSGNGVYRCLCRAYDGCQLTGWALGSCAMTSVAQAERVGRARSRLIAPI